VKTNTCNNTVINVPSLFGILLNTDDNRNSSESMKAIRCYNYRLIRPLVYRTIIPSRCMESIIWPASETAV